MCGQKTTEVLGIKRFRPTTSVPEFESPVDSGRSDFNPSSRLRDNLTVRGLRGKAPSPNATTDEQERRLQNDDIMTILTSNDPTSHPNKYLLRCLGPSQTSDDTLCFLQRP